MRRSRLSTLLLLALFAAALFLPPSGAYADLPADWEPLLEEAPQALKFPVYLGGGEIVYTMGSTMASDVYLLDTQSGESTQLAAGNGYMDIDKIFVASPGEFYYISSDTTKLCHYAGSQITDITPAALGYNGYKIVSVDGSGADNIYLVLTKSNQPSVLLHYDGNAWSSVDVSGIGGYEPAAGDFLATVCLPEEDSLYMLWIGRDINNNRVKKVSYYNGSSWSAVDGYMSDINFYLTPCMGKYLPDGKMLALCRDDKLRVYKDGAEVGAIDIAGLKSSSIIGDEMWIAAGSSHSYLMNKGVFRYNGSVIERVALPMTNGRLKGIAVDEEDNLYLSFLSSDAKGYLFRRSPSVMVELVSASPVDEGSLGGIDGEISITFNQAVEIFGDETSQVGLFKDDDEDGVGEGSAVPDVSGYLDDVLSVSPENPSKVSVNIQQYLAKNKGYVLVVTPLSNSANIRAAGSTETDPAESGQVYAGWGDAAEQTGWSFNTYEVQSIEIENTPVGLMEGDIVTLSAVARGIDGAILAGEGVSWGINNSEVAAVDETSGVLTALDDGEAMITATSLSNPHAGATIAIEVYAEAQDAVMAKINALPETVTLDDKAQVEAARSAYEDLSTGQKGLVTNLDVLESAEEVIELLEEEVEAVEAAIAQLPAAGDIVLSDKEAITQAKEAYDALSASQQAYVGNRQKLLEAINRITVIEQEIAADPLRVESYTPAVGGSLGGVVGGISLTFNRPVEWIWDDVPGGRIGIWEDTDGDGYGDVLVPGNGPYGFFHDGCVTISGDGYEAEFNINGVLEKNKRYVVSMASQLRIIGSILEFPDSPPGNGQVLPDIGDGCWYFDTYEE